MERFLGAGRQPVEAKELSGIKWLCHELVKSQQDQRNFPAKKVAVPRDPVTLYGESSLASRTVHQF